MLVFDYPGYGDTPGPASAANFELNLSAQIFTTYREAWQRVEQRSENGDLVKRVEAHDFTTMHDEHLRRL